MLHLLLILGLCALVGWSEPSSATVPQVPALLATRCSCLSPILARTPRKWCPLPSGSIPYSKPSLPGSVTACSGQRYPPHLDSGGKCVCTLYTGSDKPALLPIRYPLAVWIRCPTSVVSDIHTLGWGTFEGEQKMRDQG